MLVKKVDPEWKPSENKDLKVGETIDVSNPESLIKAGTVVAIDKDGIEVSAYELYGIVTDLDRAGFEEFLAWKKLQQQKKLNERFTQEAQELRDKIMADAVKTEPVKDAEDTRNKRLVALEKARAARKKK